MEETPKKTRYIGVIIASALRDTQFCTNTEHDPLDDEAWQDLPNAEAYLGIFECANEAEAKARAANYGSTDIENVRVIPIDGDEPPKKLCYCSPPHGEPKTLREIIEAVRTADDMVRYCRFYIFYGPTKTTVASYQMDKEDKGAFAVVNDQKVDALPDALLDARPTSCICNWTTGLPEYYIKVQGVKL